MLDLNRGVEIRSHPKGFQIGMYADEPGVFYDIMGRQVDPEMAAEAGFDVKKLTMERDRRKLIDEAVEKINRSYGDLSEGSEISSYGNYRVVYLGQMRFDVTDSSGKSLGVGPLGKREAVELAKQLAAVDEIKQEKDDGQKAKKRT